MGLVLLWEMTCLETLLLTAADSHTGSKVESGKESRTCFGDCQCPSLKEGGGLRL